MTNRTIYFLIVFRLMVIPVQYSVGFSASAAALMRAVVQRQGSDLPRTVRILDVLCGDGRDTIALARFLTEQVFAGRRSLDILGIDEDASLIRTASERARVRINRTAVNFCSDRLIGSSSVLRPEAVDWFVFQDSFHRIPPSHRGDLMDMMIRRTQYIRSPRSVGVIFDHRPAALSVEDIDAYFQACCPSPYEALSTRLSTGRRLTGVIVFPPPPRVDEQYDPRWVAGFSTLKSRVLLEETEPLAAAV